MTQFFSSAAAQLLERDAPAEYRAQWTAIFAAPRPTLEATSKTVLVFRIASEWLALSTEIVQEITQGYAVHSVPHRTGGMLRGITNVRGEILLSVALDVFLGLERPHQPAATAQAVHSAGRTLVCNRNGDRLAFTVAEVHGVHRYLPSALREVPATLAKSEARYTAGILLWKENRSIAVLDDELLFYALNRGLT